MGEVSIDNKTLEIMSDDAWTGIPIVKTLSREVLRLRKVNDKAFESAAILSESGCIDIKSNTTLCANTIRCTRIAIAEGIRDLKTSND